MLNEGPLAGASRNNIVVVPVSECTQDVAKRVLLFIYTLDCPIYPRDITDQSLSMSLSLASLGHKLNIKVCRFRKVY